MISNSDVLDQEHVYTSTFPTEIMNWYYSNDQDTIIVIWNNSNEIIYASNIIKEYFQKNVSDVIGKQWTELLPKEQVTRINKHFGSKSKKINIQNIIIPSEEGQIYSFNGIIDKITINEECFTICKLRNATYTSELRQMLLDSEKLIRAGQLSAGLVHEIRNPLTSLKGFLQLVQAGVKQKEEYYKVMIGEIEKLEKITSELLHMAKPFQNKKKKEYIYQMIDDVLFIMSSQTDLRDVKINTDIETNLVTKCNASQIKQVLINLIKNGAEAMDKKGEMLIQASRQEDFIAIDITDEGPGIKKDVVEQLQDPFFTTKQDGTGLGLVITHHILEMHYGELKVHSEEGEGTTFTIILPAISEE